MKKFISTSLVIISVFLACTGSANAERFHGGHGGGWGFAPFLFGAAAIATLPYYAPYYSPYYASQPMIIQQPAPEMYVQPAAQQMEQNYWYYCENSQSYYPYVKQCPNGWMKVVPTPPGP